MENGPFIDNFPIKTTIYRGFSMAMLNNQMVFKDGVNTVFCLEKRLEISISSPEDRNHKKCILVISRRVSF